MHRATVVTLLILCSTLPGWGQGASTSAPPERMETISVVGVGRSHQAPDRVVFTVGVTTLAATVAAAVNENNTKAKSITSSLKNLGVADEAIRTSNFSIQPQYEYQEGKRPRITGYQVSNSLTVREDAAADVGKLLQSAVDAGANEVGQVFFTVHDPTRGRDAGLRAAFMDARAKAELLAKAAARSLGRALSITEGAVPQPPQPLPFFKSVAREAQMDVPIEPGTEEVQFTVSAVFELR